MKLKYERFEGLSSFSVRGAVQAHDVKILQVGLESMVKDLDTTLVVNLSLATIPAALTPELLAIKKAMVPPEKIKIHWISPVKNLGDFPSLPPFTSRLNGMKYRQIGDRLNLDDELYTLHETLVKAQADLAAISGDADKAHQMILQNRILKEQERILRETIGFQKERTKLQVATPSLNPDLPEKLTIAKAEAKRLHGKDLDL